MRDPIRRLSRFLLFLALAMAVAAAPVFAQGGATSTIAGTVTDTSGAVVPGADIVIKNSATNNTFNAVSGSDGAFTVPAVPPGTYTVTVTLMGFKTAVLNDVIANVAQVAQVKAVLTLGALEETVIVSGATEIIQTQATSVASTLGTKQIASLPIQGRGAFDLVSYMPGVATTTGSIRDSTVNGLPQSAVNITLDGMNIQDNYAKSWDGMFTRVSPRIDAVEEVTVSTAAQGADMGSQGAAQVRFVTRSGTNKFQGSAYFYYRRDWMNTNTWFNLNRNVDPLTGKPTPKSKVFQDQPGFRVGGPIWKDKAFFFVNYEWISSPGTRTDTRTIMSPPSEQGQFQYAGGTVDLMALAAKNGHKSTIDPAVAKLLADVRSTTGKGTVTTSLDPLVAELRVGAGHREHDEVPDGPPRLQPHVETPAHGLGHLQSPDLESRHHEQHAGDLPWLPGARAAGLGALQLAGVDAVHPHLEHGERGPVRAHGRRNAVLSGPRRSDVQQLVVRRHEGLRDRLEQLQEHQQPVPGVHAQRARGLDDGDRGHAELAEGQARPDPRRIRDAR